MPRRGSMKKGDKLVGTNRIYNGVPERLEMTDDNGVVWYRYTHETFTERPAYYEIVGITTFSTEGIQSTDFDAETMYHLRDEDGNIDPWTLSQIQAEPLELI